MRIFNWVQDKLYGKQEKRISSFSHNTLTSNSRKEEFDDWPQTLLAIGTLGENKMKKDTSRNEPSKIPQAPQNLPDFTSEEVDKLHKELIKLLSQKQETKANESERGEERANLPLNRFLNCPSNLDGDQTSSTKNSNNFDIANDADISTNAKIILTKATDLLADKKRGIRKTSLKLLLKKMFVCHSGFVPTPSLREPFLETRMEKILRAMLHKKIYPHSSAQPTTKKYMDRQPLVKRLLENKYMDRFQVEEKKEKGEESNKWVKTDSEYIVLEI